VKLLPLLLLLSFLRRFLRCLHRVSSGELSSANYFQIQKLLKLISQCARTEDVERQYQSLLEIKVVNNEIQKDLNKALLVTNELSKSQAALSARVLNLENLVASKLDRSDLHLLESLANKVSLFDDFRTKTVLAIEHLQSFQTLSTKRMDDINSIMAKLENAIKQNANDIAKTASKKETHQLAKELAHHSAAIALCASKQAVSEVRFISYFAAV
jgi:hypothetical protein